MRDLLIKKMSPMITRCAPVTANYNYTTDGQKAEEGGTEEGRWIGTIISPGRFLIRLRSLCHKLSATTRTLE